MFHDGVSFWGMHMFWWLFWVLLIVSFFGVATPVPRSRAKQTPLDILQRRYAAGEISTAEYEERKEKLTRDIAARK